MTNVDFIITSNDFLMEEIGLKGKKKHYVTGYITTTDPDLYDEIVPEEEMDGIVEQLTTRNIKLDIDHSLFRGEDSLMGEHTGAIGKIVEAKKVYDKGKAKVWVKAELNEDNSKFSKVLNQIKNGFIDAFSIAYKATTETMYDAGKTFKVLRNINLANVAITGDPINAGSVMDGYSYKSAGRFRLRYGEQMEDIHTKAKYIRREGSAGNYKYFYNEKKSPRKDTTMADLIETTATRNAIQVLNQISDLIQEGNLDATEAIRFAEETLSPKAFNIIKEELQTITNDATASNIQNNKKDAEAAYDSAVEYILDGSSKEQVIKYLQKEDRFDGYSEDSLRKIAEQAWKDEEEIAKKHPDASPLGKEQKAPESKKGPKTDEKKGFYVNENDPHTRAQVGTYEHSATNKFQVTVSSKEEEPESKFFKTKEEAVAYAKKYVGMKSQSAEVQPMTDETQVENAQSEQSQSARKFCTKSNETVSLKSFNELNEAVVALKSKVESLEAENVELKSKLEQPMLKSAPQEPKAEEVEVSATPLQLIQ